MKEEAKERKNSPLRPCFLTRSRQRRGNAGVRETTGTPASCRQARSYLSQFTGGAVDLDWPLRQ